MPSNATQRITAFSKNFSGLLPKNRTVPFFNWPSLVTNFRLVNNCSFEVTLTKPASKRNVLIFSSIANPEVFYETIKKLNPKNIKEIKFSDHHMYTENEILNIEKEGENFDYIITTEKDIVKINKNIKKLLVLKMKFEIV